MPDLALLGLTNEEAAGYDAPFASSIYNAAPRTFPAMIPAVDEDDLGPEMASIVIKFIADNPLPQRST